MTRLAIVIPSYNRGAILLDTLDQLLRQDEGADEIIVVDQTRYPSNDSVAKALSQLDSQSKIRWLQKTEPSIPKAMNAGLISSRCEWVLFLDDDIRVAPDFIQCHRAVIKQSVDGLAHVGQVVQPWQDVGAGKNTATSREDISISADLNFAFNAADPSRIQNCMAGNLCVNRKAAVQAGGFDENFCGVAYRFETEFCKRFCRYHSTLFHYAPPPVLHHLHHQSGGTRAHANHLTSWSPVHSMGDYYYALLQAEGAAGFNYVVHRWFTAIVAKFYLKRPWYIPVRLIAETRGLILAWLAYRRGPSLIRVADDE